MVASSSWAFFRLSCICLGLLHEAGQLSFVEHGFPKGQQAQQHHGQRRVFIGRQTQLGRPCRHML
jgi:hypothetical protein